MTQALNLTSFGAKFNGADDTMALSLALAVGREQQQPVLIPAGAVCAYSDVLLVDGTELSGEPGATLHALNAERCAITLRGVKPSVRDLRLTGVKPLARSQKDTSVRVLVLDATEFTVAGMTIESSAGAGILVRRSDSGIVKGNHISDTLADSIHITEKSATTWIVNNTIERSGDDGIAVVSYRAKGMCHHITAQRNRISANVNGRCMSVVGGSDIVYEFNELSGNAKAAGLYICREKAYDTFGVSNVLAQRNTIVNCGNKAIDHAAVMLFTDDVEANANVQLVRNLVVLDGVRDAFFLYGQRQTGIALDQNLVVKAAKEYRIGTPGVLVTAYAAGAVGVQQ